MRQGSRVHALSIAGFIFSFVASNVAAFADDAAKTYLLPPTSLPNTATSILRVGDHIKLSFYERLDVDETRWRNSGGQAVEAPREFHERAELSGRYEVQDDGTISLPMMGRLQVADHTVDEMIKPLQTSFESLIGRKGFVTVLSVEHCPIYIVGPVKTPGAYPYEPGLTPLHAIALAGGLKQEAVEGWQQVETGRELVELQRSLDRIKRLVARTFVLKAERDGAKAEIPELASLVGKADLRELSSDERAQRELVELSRNSQQAVLASAIEAARADVRAREERAAPFDAEMKLLDERVKSIQKLVDKNIVGRPVLIQAQSAMTEAQDRRSRFDIEAESARSRLRESERELAKSRAEAKVEIARAVAVAEQDTTEAVSQGEGTLNMLKTMTAATRNRINDDDIVFEVIRRTPSGTTTLKPSELSALEPGDLIRIRMRKSTDEAVATDP